MESLRVCSDRFHTVFFVLCLQCRVRHGFLLHVVMMTWMPGRKESRCLKSTTGLDLKE